MASLHLADVNRMKVSFFGELLLAESGTSAARANVFAQMLANFSDSRHGRVRKQSVVFVAIA